MEPIFSVKTRSLPLKTAFEIAAFLQNALNATRLSFNSIMLGTVFGPHPKITKMDIARFAFKLFTCFVFTQHSIAYIPKREDRGQQSRFHCRIVTPFLSPPPPPALRLERWACLEKQNYTEYVLKTIPYSWWHGRQLLVGISIACSPFGRYQWQDQTLKTNRSTI